MSTVGLLERSAYLLSWVTCPFPEHCGFKLGSPRLLPAPQHSIKSQGKDERAEDSMESLIWRMYDFDSYEWLRPPPYIPSLPSPHDQDKAD